MMTKDEKVLKILKWRTSIEAFLTECFPEHFNKPFAPFQREILEMLVKFQRVAIGAPRKHGKSSLITFGYVMWKLFCDPNCHFIILIANNYANATKFLEPIKLSIEENRILKEVFGSQKSDKWSENEIELKCRKKVLVGGNDFKIRGQKYLQWRPNLVVSDDIEDDELVRSEVRRGDLEHWLSVAVEPAMAQDLSQIVFIGTVLHRDSQLSKLLLSEGRYRDWKSKKYTAIKESGEALWPENISLEYLISEKEKDPLKFAQEYMNNPVPYENAMFKVEYFDDYKDDALPKDLVINITVDLACTEKEYSDYTVIMPVGVDMFGDLWILPYHRARYADPDKIINAILDMYEKYAFNTNLNWKFGRLGVEKVAFQRFLIKALDKARKARGLHFSIEEIDAKGDKVQRISQLQTWFSSGDIHIRSSMIELKEELLDFPKSRHDDCADALAFHLNFLSKKPLVKNVINEGFKVTPERQRSKILNRGRFDIKPKVYNNF